MRRVLLDSTYDPDAPDTAPNCDPDAALVLRAVGEVVASHRGDGLVVLAVDAPLRALDRPYLARRNRRVPGGTERRQCERAATEGQRGDNGRDGWKGVWNVQAGAGGLASGGAVAGLQGLGFGLYEAPDRPPGQRILFECFPGEALWRWGRAAVSATPCRARPRNTRPSGSPTPGCGAGRPPGAGGRGRRS